MTPPRTIDLNADLGEDPAHLARDIELLAVVSSANIACGGHAGDAATMTTVARRCRDLGVAIGAHPSYPDPANFGRTELPIALPDLHESLVAQLAALAAILAETGDTLAHIKPHGALYHAAARSDVARVIASAAAQVFPARPVLVGAANSPALDHWARAGFPVIAEGFADRRYEPSGLLRSRSLAGAVHDHAAARDQAVSIARDHAARTEAGTLVSVHARTICIHSDTPDAVAIARSTRAAIEAAGITIARITA